MTYDIQKRSAYVIFTIEDKIQIQNMLNYNNTLREVVSNQILGGGDYRQKIIGLSKHYSLTPCQQLPCRRLES